MFLLGLVRRSIGGVCELDFKTDLPTPFLLPLALVFWQFTDRLRVGRVTLCTLEWETG